jgi:hypothetical protein
MSRPRISTGTSQARISGIILLLDEQAAQIFARRVGGIDSIAEGHWTVGFRRSIFVHL